MNILVTITYNALRHGILDPFFASIAAQVDQDFILLVIDNASDDGTSDYLRDLTLPNVRVIQNRQNVGFGRACNQGIDLARQMDARFITFINNDVVFGPELVGEMVASLQATGAAALSPLIVPYGRPDHIWFIHGTFRWRRGIIPYHNWIWQPRRNAPAERLQYTDFATGCCLMIRMSVFEKISGFDDRFFVYWEDADLSMAMKAADLPIIVDTSLTLEHKVSISTEGSFSAFSVYHFNRGHMIFIRKHYGLAIALPMLPLLFAKMVLNIMRGRFRIREIGIWFRGIGAGLAQKV